MQPLYPISGNFERKLSQFPTYSWNSPETPKQQFMKKLLSFGVKGDGVCPRGMLGFPKKYVITRDAFFIIKYHLLTVWKLNIKYPK